MPKNKHVESGSRRQSDNLWRLTIGAAMAVWMMVPSQVTDAQSPGPPSAAQQANTSETSEQPEGSAAATGERSEPKSKYRTEPIRGRVVWLAKALKDEFGISTVPEAAENVLAIRTDDGQLLPIVENVRGRAFRKDQRLRDRPMEILARRYDAQPLIQILRVFEIVDGERYEVDYWCDVCAIVMFETGPCSCCQDHNRLRKRNSETGEEIP